MEEAVVGSVIGGTIQVVLQNLLSVPVEEFNLFRNFKKDLKRLTDSFLMIQDFLHDAETQQVTNKAVNRWLRRLESVAFEADNVLDELNYHVLRNQKEKKVKTFFKQSNPIAIRLKMAHSIRNINGKLKSINREARDFGLQGTKPVDGGPNAVTGRETDSFAADPIVLGREDDVSRIVEKLTIITTEEAFLILPIVGMGGLGKTTLARQVFNNEKVKAHFHKQIWVYVSQNFDAVILFKKILESLTTNNKVELGSREALLKSLHEELRAKRFLLVLDDVWNEKREKWDDFLNSLSGISSVMGNSIIVTTRSKEVASIVKTLPIYELKSLEEDECWSIIKAKAFREGEVPLEFEIIGRNIANRCQGLPLAAKVVGGLLCNKSKEEWLSIEETWLSKFGEDENTILKVLKYSFDQLPSPLLKRCFAYCSIFSKGFQIGKEQLIEHWMAEGFLTTHRRNDMETVGNKFLNHLVQNSLLQVEWVDVDGDIISCSMHDLVHDLASSVLGFKSDYANDKSLDDIHQVRYITESFSIPKEHARCVRTLIFKNKVSDNMFSDFKSLHSLVLRCLDIRELPGSISELIHLRLLDISYTTIKSLPDSIGKLYHLQTLRTVFIIGKLPNTLKNLISLRHLYIPKIELPPEIGRLTSLQTLPFFQVGNEKGCRIGELGSLNNLKGELIVHNLEKVADNKEARSAYLIRKPHIFKLKFAWDKSREGETNDESVLEGLQPHPNLKSLEIDAFKGRSFPLWTLKMEVRQEGRWIGLNKLVDIRLTGCEEFEEIPRLGHLPHLKFLCLQGLTNVRSIGSSFYGIDNCSTSNRVGKNTIILFPALETIELSEMPNLREWVEAEFPSGAETQLLEMVVFPHIRHLTINRCFELRRAPTHFSRLDVLNIDTMGSASPLANICGNNIVSLGKLEIHGVNGLVCLPNALFSNAQNLLVLSVSACPNLTHLISSLQGGGASLRELYVGWCPNLRELPNDLHSLNSLETLNIIECPTLRSIPYPSGRASHEGFTSLLWLIIDACDGLTNLPTEMIESCAPSLNYLKLKRLCSLTNLHMVLGCLRKMPRLISLEIVDVPTSSNLSMKIGSLHSLEKLFIGASCLDSLDYKLMREFLNDICKGSHSLRELVLYGMGHWDSLPDELQHLTALRSLELNGFGMEALPDWLGNISSLKILLLRNCKKLRRLPSKEAMQRPTKLMVLPLNGCPLLNMDRCNE